MLGDIELSDDAVRAFAAAAALIDADLLDYAAHQFGLGNPLVWRRAAHWAGYGFAETLPSHRSLPRPRIDHLEHLGGVRSLRQRTLGQDLSFVAPRFEQVLNLKRGRTPISLRRIRFAPPEAFEAALTRAASDQLMDQARQRTVEVWPARLRFARSDAWRPHRLCRPARAARRPRHDRGPRGGPYSSRRWRCCSSHRASCVSPRCPKSPVPLPPLLGDAELPIYTILIPLRDEAQMVPLLKRAMTAIDYPSHRLDIKFVVEAKSPETVEAVERILDDPRFRLVVVPPGSPHTKPKAINYALPLARGEYLVVYDAEDAPAPDQLRLAASLFAADPDLACLQAELVPENAHENALTALFAGEYAGLFGRLLPALVRWRLPVPLGGTSNHFRTAILRDIGGWDAFNVTEDADLGVRLARRGLRAEAFASPTYEEAPVSLKAWLAQRTRWMKGWMQTYVVHNRAPGLLLKEIGWRGFIGFQVLVGGMIVSSLLHTMFMASLLFHLLTEGVVGLIPSDALDWFSVLILATGYGGAFAIVVSGLLHQKAAHLIPIQLLLPFYWILHSWAAVLAAIELITHPIHWAKTTHGVTRLKRSADDTTRRQRRRWQEWLPRSGRQEG